MAIATKRPKKVCQMRRARWLPATNNLERLKCKLLERMYIYFFIYMYDCREDPPVLGVCLGMWNFLNILHVRFMFIEPPKWPADQDAWFTGLPGNQRVVSDQNLKNHTLVPVSVK